MPEGASKERPLALNGGQSARRTSALALAVAMGVSAGFAAAGDERLAVAIMLLVAVAAFGVLAGPSSVLFALTLIGDLPVFGQALGLLRMAILVIGAWELRDAKHALRILANPVTVLLVATSVYMGLSVWFANDQAGARQLWVSFVFSVVLFGLAVTAGLRDEKHVRSFLVVVVAVGAGDACLTLAQAAFGYGFMPDFFQSAISRATVDAYVTAGQQSAAGLFPHRAQNAVFLLFPLAVSLACFIWRTVLPPLASAVVSGLACSAVIATQSRAGVGLMCLILALATMSSGSLRKHRTLRWGLMLALLGGLLYGVGSTGVGQGLLLRLNEATIRTDFEVGRLAVWRAGIRAFAASPVWGYGPASFTNVAGVEREAHNAYVQTLVEGGILGITLAIATLVMSVRQHRRLLRIAALPPAVRVLGVASLWYLLVCLINGVIGAGPMSGLPFMALPLTLPVGLAAYFVQSPSLRPDSRWAKASQDRGTTRAGVPPRGRGSEESGWR